MREQVPVERGNSGSYRHMGRNKPPQIVAGRVEHELHDQVAVRGGYW